MLQSIPSVKHANSLRRARHAAFLRAMLCVTLAGQSMSVAVFAQQKPKARKEQRLGAGQEWRRDAASGEMEYRRKAAGAKAEDAGGETGSRGTLRVGVNLVEVNCNVLGEDGKHVNGLTAESFRLFDGGVPQTIAHFDASSEAASVALVMDASPSVLRDIAEMKAASRTLAGALAPQDEVAVVTFDAEAYLLLPFSRDRVALEKAIEQVNVARRPSSKKGSNIYEAVYLVAQELFPGRTGRKAIVLLTDGQDSGLGLSWSPESATPRADDAQGRLTFEDVGRALARAGVEMHVVSTQPRPKGMTNEWLAAQRHEMLVSAKARELEMPHYTLYLAELVRRAGGRIYFLREMETLRAVYREIAENLRTQYTVGYYPAVGDRNRGWRLLRVEVPGRADAKVVHRVMYYAAGTP